VLINTRDKLNLIIVKLMQTTSLSEYCIKKRCCLFILYKSSKVLRYYCKTLILTDFTSSPAMMLFTLLTALDTPKEKTNKDCKLQIIL